MAFELLQIYAAREVAQGHAFPPDAAWDVELEESFPYRETPDQLKAIDDVKHDMETPRPMDRLVCGDVGYGKTEVALRAAFKAVNDGMQVAVLVPTTVLALQHYDTFRERLAAFPVKVEMLSRLRTAQEQSGSSRGWPAARSTSSSAPTGCCRKTSASRTWACWWSTRSSASACATRSTSSRCAPRWTC